MPRAGRKKWYGRRPVVVETYIDPADAGTCFLATGWRLVGRTSGRRHRRGVAEAPTRTDLELAILKDVVRTRNRPPPSDLGSAFLLVASLGRFLNHPNDLPPGFEAT